MIFRQPTKTFCSVGLLLLAFNGCAHVDRRTSFEAEELISCEPACLGDAIVNIGFIDTGLDDASSRRGIEFANGSVAPGEHFQIGVEYFWGRTETWIKRPRSPTFTVKINRAGCEEWNRKYRLDDISANDGPILDLGEISLNCR